MVRAPGEIDVESLAWLAGSLHIEEGGLDTAEGSLVASEKGGVIRVNHRSSPGRKRFTVAHEIGHRVVHGTSIHSDSLRQLRQWTGDTREREANVFAAELLMPTHLFAPQVHRRGASMEGIRDLAALFRTSLMATEVNFVHHTREPCALVVCSKDKVLWSVKSRDFGWFIAGGRPHEFTTAAEVLNGKRVPTDRMDKTPAGAWLEGFDPNDDQYLYEGCRVLRELGHTVSLLWVDEPLG